MCCSAGEASLPKLSLVAERTPISSGQRSLQMSCSWMVLGKNVVSHLQRRVGCSSPPAGRWEATQGLLPRVRRAGRLFWNVLVLLVCLLRLGERILMEKS